MRPDPTTNVLLASLSPTDREAVLAACAAEPLELAQTIIAPGQPIDQVNFVLSGIISTVNEMADGRSVEAFMIGFEGAAGVEATVIPAAAYSRQTVQVAGETLRIDAARLRALAEERPGLRKTLARYHAGIQHELEQTAACHALHRSERRLAKWLLRCHDRVQGDVMRLTQEYMASMLGSQRTTVNEAAQFLQAEGAVAYARGKVTVLDRQRLEAASCECYRKTARPEAA